MKYTGPRVKLSRQLGLPLTPKSNRFMERRPYPPGEHGEKKMRRSKTSDYKKHLMEKQRLRAQYNLHERQLRNAVQKAVHESGNTEDRIIQKLETRLDAFVMRAGLARTIYAARQYVLHRHILVNGRWVNIPSQKVKVEDEVTVKEKSRKLPCFVEAAEEMINPPPPYIERTSETMTARLLRMPTREEVPVSCDMPLVIEYYSR